MINFWIECITSFQYNQQQQKNQSEPPLLNKASWRMKRGRAPKTNSYNSKKQRLGFTRAPEYPVILAEATSLLESACHSMNKVLTFLHVFDVCKLMCCSTSTLRFCTSAFANERIWKQYLTTLLDPWGSYVSISLEVLTLFFFFSN